MPREQRQKLWDRHCWGLTHVGVEGKVEVSSELISGAATPVLKHMQVGLTLELEGRREGP